MALQIQPANPAAYLIQGFQAGASVAEARARMAIQQRMAQEAAERQSYEAALEENREALRRAQFDAELGLKQQAQQLAAEEQAQRANQVATRLGAMQQYRMRVAGGEDPSSALLELGPLMGGQESSMAALMRRKEIPDMPTSLQSIPVLDPITQTPIPGAYAVRSPSGGIQVHEQPGYASEQAGIRSIAEHQRQNQVAMLRAERSEITKSILTSIPADPKTAPNLAKQQAEAKNRIAEIDDQLKRLTGSQSQVEARSFKPVPPKADRKEGETYQSSKGLYTWTPNGWIPYTLRQDATEPDEEQAPVSED